MSLSQEFEPEAALSAAELLVPTIPVEDASREGGSEETRVAREPMFLTPRDFFRSEWGEMVRGLLEFSSEPTKIVFLDLFREVPVLSRRFAGKPLAASLSAHLVGLAILPALLQIVAQPVVEQDESLRARHEVVYYHFHRQTQPSPLPRLLPNGPGSRPGMGEQPKQATQMGASKPLSALYAVSRPRIPDNDHQTILQPNSPDDLRIKTDLTLPNLVVEGPAVSRPRLQYNANEVHPMQPSAHESKVDAPTLAKGIATPAANGMLGAMVRQPHLAVPLGGDSAPVVSSRHYGDMGANDPPISAAAGGEEPGPGLVIIGLNPSGSNADVALPPGNRDGQFTIAPANPGQASPRGEEGSYGHGGTAENGPGENASTGVGNGTYEGGGGESGAGSGFVSVRSGRTGENGLSDPGPGLTAQLVYAIPEAALLRHHELVVSAGPMGGGGSNVYGVLPCGKIYTVFLATGQKEWSLQYCQKSQSTDSAENGTRRTVVHTELPILPPEAEKRYDFKRLPLPPQKAHKTILLRGTINEDGKVDNVEIYRGLQPTMDEAAQMAFRQWKFKPAMRSGKPVRVEILISIPMEPAEVSVK